MGLGGERWAAALSRALGGWRERRRGTMRRRRRVSLGVEGRELFPLARCFVASKPAETKQQKKRRSKSRV
jgi:hypothetical protein